MQHFSPIYYLAVIFIAVLVTHSEAKRGCALYGHSCYGGHGKRSDVPRVDMLSLETPQDKPYSNINKEIFYPTNNELNGVNQIDSNNENRWKSRNEFNFALFNLLRRWIDDAKKGSEEVQQQTPEADTIFKNTFV
ncbi:neuropeptide CCHamide-2-like isoform X2 [Sitodiplosis mosellana]|uniref:neuropeptide CCHamide-2-like isoform X2 n=1 Tax=Sitodiplosis mosellana TaxID=263140 RepID=UPI002444B528|nr:neuropeptide CCHamide-2-like isoform X2 [Sitodiplosis mosellana]